MTYDDSFESLVRHWEKFASVSNAKLSIEKYLSDRKFSELSRDLGEIPPTKELPYFSAKLERSVQGFPVIATSQPFDFGQSIVTFETNFVARERFAFSVQTKFNLAQMFYRKLLVKRFQILRLHENVAQWDESICGQIQLFPFEFSSQSLEKVYTAKASENAKLVLNSHSLEPILCGFRKRIWFWARGVPEFEQLSSNGLSSIIVLKSDSTELLSQTFELFDVLLNELQAACLIRA